MATFAVVVDEPAPQVEKRLAEYSPVQIGPAAWLVVSDDLSQVIAEKAGIKGAERDVDGIVLGLNGAYAGFHRSDVWEWFRRYLS